MAAVVNARQRIRLDIHAERAQWRTLQSFTVFYEILPFNYGSGALSVTSTGEVVSSDRAIDVSIFSYGTSLNISVASVTAGSTAIAAQNGGSGAMSITATGDVVSTSGYGIRAFNRDNGTSFDVSAAAVSGGRYGILARNTGSGALSVTSTGNVIASSGVGISASNTTHGTSINVSAASVSGGIDGIVARNLGAGLLSVATTGTVTGAARRGIDALSLNGTDVVVTTATVSGDYDGIFAHNYGTGALSVTSTGNVTGTTRLGIDTISRNGTDVTVVANSVRGGRDGIIAWNYGSGSVLVSTNGTVTGDTLAGIYAYNNAGTNLTVSTATVSGRTEGIRAVNKGSGAVSVTARGSVSATEESGIFALNAQSGTNVSISTAAVSGGTYGIYATNYAEGALSVTSTSDVTGTSRKGIFARNYGTGLTISAADVSGSTDGVHARSGGTGALSVTTTGTVSGDTGEGIFAINFSSGTDLTISAASVSGSIDGIYARNESNGTLSVTVSGAVLGGTGTGIKTKSNAGRSTLVHLLSTASVSATSGAAIDDGEGNAAVTLDAGALVTGAITLGDGDDTLNIGSGSSLTGVSTLSGGSGEFVDTLNLNVAWSGALSDWEVVNANTIDSDFTLSGVLSGTGSLTKRGEGGLTLTGDNSFSGGLTISEGSVIASNATLGSGAIVNNAALVFDQSVDGGFSAGISGTGTLTKFGTGTLFLNGNNALNGRTLISQGRLNVRGSLAGSAVTVQSGASLGGNGTIGSLTAQAGSTVSPGNSIGTLSVNGDVTLASGSMLAMEVSPTSSDLIAATGSAVISGSLVVTAGAGTYTPQSYTLLSSSSLTGIFSAISLGDYGTSLRPTIIYNGTSVILRLDPNSLVEVSGRTLRGNNLAVATAFDTSVLGGYNPQPFLSLYTQGANLASSLGQFTGELHSAERRVSLQDTRVVRESALDSLNADLVARTGTSSVTNEAAGKSKTVWMRAAGSWGTAQADGIGSASKTDLKGVLLGVDFASNGFKMGVLFHQTSSELELGQLGRSKVESVGATLYAGYRHDGSGFAMGFGAGLASNTASAFRAIVVPGLSQGLSANTDSMTYQVFGEASYDLAKADDARVEPFVRVAHIMLDSKAFAETGGIAALRADKQSNVLTTTTFGLRGAKVIGKTTLSSSAGWQCTAGDRSAPTFAAIPGVNVPYEVRSVALDRNAVALETQANFSLSQSMTIGFGYSALVGSNNADHSGRVTLRYAF